MLWSQVAHKLLQDGSKVSACSREWAVLPNHLLDLVNEGCELFLVPAPPVSVRDTLVMVLNKCVKRSPQRRFGDWLDREQPDIVLFSMGNAVEGFEWIEECRRRGHPFALLIQLVSEHNWLTDDQSIQMIDIYENATRCFFVSLANQRLVEKMAGFSMKNAEIVQNPYNVPFDDPFRWVDQKETCRLACVANLHALHKGQDILLEVLRQTKWKERSIEVSLFGDGPHKHILNRLKTIWGVENVKFRGFSDNIAEVWRDHHALLMPSRMEGMPLALKEAMVCGRVPIVTDVGGNAELVEDGVDGFIIKAPTAQLLDEALERAWEARSEWEQIGFRAYQKARKVISPDPVADFEMTLSSLVKDNY